MVVGIPDQQARLEQLYDELLQVRSGEKTIEEVIKDYWWIRKRPDNEMCKRCVVLKSALLRRPE